MSGGKCDAIGIHQRESPGCTLQGPHLVSARGKGPKEMKTQICEGNGFAFTSGSGS